MQLPSLDHIVRQASHTFKRFPLALLSSILATAIAIYLVDSGSIQDNYFLVNTVAVAILGIPLFTIIPLTCEQKDWNFSLEVGLYAVGLILLALYHIFLPNNLDNAAASHGYRYLLYFIGVHLLVAIAPYWGGGETNSFWQYNKTLFLRFLTAILFSGVLFIGLAVALGSIEVLLNIDVYSARYLQLFYVIAGVFNTWFFLAGIPPIEKFDQHQSYPKGLKIFTQNVLIPLVTIYVIILYLYMGKIILQWAWPEGWISILVLSFSVVGILANLLLHPIRNDAENHWVKRFAKGYYWALVPLTILLWFAIGIRINEYGFTVERYFVLVLGLWLAGIVGYFIISKTKNIKIIPGSLCILAFAISLGPWSAFQVSERSQLNRLQDLLQKNERASSNKEDSITLDYYSDINNTLNYLDDTHGLNRAAIAARLGVDRITVWENTRSQNSSKKNHRFTASSRRSIPVGSYEWMIQDVNLYGDVAVDSMRVGQKKLVIHLKPDSMLIQIQLGQEAKKVMNIPLSDLGTQLIKKHASQPYDVPPEKMVVTESTNWGSAKLYLTYIRWEMKKNHPRLSGVRFDLLLSLKP